MSSCLHSAGPAGISTEGRGAAWSSWGAAAQLCWVAFGDVAQVPLPAFLGTGTQVFT